MTKIRGKSVTPVNYEPGRAKHLRHSPSEALHSARTEELLRAMPSGSQSGAAFGRNRLPFGRAMLVIGVLSALSWAIVIATVLGLLYASGAGWWGTTRRERT